MSGVRLVSVGDACLSLVLAETIDPQVNARCVAVAQRLEARALAGLRDVVPTFNTIAVHFDPLRIDRRELEKELKTLADVEVSAAADEESPVEIPVRYGGESGRDLADVAAFGGCSEQDVIRLHTGTVYRVYMLGFLPGFAYMGTVPTRIAMPRLETPRGRVAAGSVGIAGGQTGIYPCESPGGWRLIGRTEATLFDPSKADPFLLKAGVRVRFVAA